MDFSMIAGDTLFRTWRWGSDQISYAPITGITQGAPVVITATAHNIPPGWSAAVVSAVGMDELSTDFEVPRQKDFHAATVVDPNTISFNGVNSTDFTPYVSGGFLMFNTPVDITGMTAKAQIMDAVGGNLLLDISSYFTINPTTYSIILEIPATITAAITWPKGVFSLEMINGSVVTTIDYGNITVVQKATI